MDFTEYQTLAARTQNQRLNNDEKLKHAIFGLCAEAGEIASLYQKEYQGHAVVIDELLTEIGDCMWFLAELCDVNALKLSTAAEMNIDKLKKRYPEGFDPNRSLFR